MNCACIVHDEDGIPHNSFGNPFFFQNGSLPGGGGMNVVLFFQDPNCPFLIILHLQHSPKKVSAFHKSSLKLKISHITTKK